jgi:small conductance mechanosensitive channel
MGRTGRRRRSAFPPSRQAVLLAAAFLAAAPAAGEEVAPPEGPTPAELPSAPERPLDPEQSAARVLLWIRRILEEDRQRLAVLLARSRVLDDRLEAASERFERLDEELAAARQAGEGRETAPGAAPEGAPAAELVWLETEWEHAREEVDLLLRSRQGVDQHVQILERKLEKQKEALQVVTTGGLPQSPAPSPEARAEPEAPPQAAPSPAPSLGLPSLPFASPSASGPASPSARPEEETFDRRVAAAEREVASHLAAVRGAERRALLLEQLLALNREDLELERATTETSRRQQALFEGEAAELEVELKRLGAAGAPAREQGSVKRRIEQRRRLAAEAAQAAESDAARVTSLESRIETLESIQAPTNQRISEAERRLESARRYLGFLKSPFAPHRILQWLLSSGPRVAVVLAVLLLVWLLGRRLAGRLVAGMVRRSRYGSEEERLERVDTLHRALKSGITLAVVTIGALALLPEFGVDVTVLLGGAAVFSLAIAFGAQNLVKDYFAGFMILVENQYSVGNVVQINETSGLVEDMTLRITTLRDLEGVAHFIPHSQIQTVSNLTYGWSRVMLDVGVAYKEDVDHVMQVLLELAREMRKDPEFGPLIVDEPEMLGVDAFAESAVVIKLIVRTRPLKQWAVKRELLRRIKNRFDELGIEIPFPHRTVYHRSADGPIAAELSHDSGFVSGGGSVSTTTRGNAVTPVARPVPDARNAPPPSSRD